MLSRLCSGTKGQAADVMGIMVSTIITILILIIFVVISAAVKTVGEQNGRAATPKGPELGVDLNSYFWNFLTLVEKKASGNLIGGGGNG